MNRPAETDPGAGAEADPGRSGGVVGHTLGVRRSSSGSSVAPIRYPALDGCRALAAIGVFVTHLGLLSGFITRNEGVGRYMARMDVGVSIFFMLSGFLLYRPFVAARFAGRPSRDLGTYARRRLLRIFPAYWVALTVIAFVFRSPGFDEPHSIVAHYFLIHIYDSTQLIGGPIQQSWTLATEIAFYAFLPCWAWLMARRSRSARNQLRVEVVALLAMAVVSILGNIALVAIGLSGGRFAQLGMWIPFRIAAFVPGMLLAVFSAWVAERSIRLPGWLTGSAMTLACWAGALVAFWVVSTRLDLPMFPNFTAGQAFIVRIIYGVVAILLVTPAVIGRQDRGPAISVFGNRLAVWLGLVSYGIYIWHEAWMDLYFRWFDQPVLNTGIVPMAVFTVVVTLVAAAASWYLVERPVMKFGTRHFEAKPGPRIGNR